MEYTSEQILESLSIGTDHSLVDELRYIAEDVGIDLEDEEQSEMYYREILDDMITNGLLNTDDYEEIFSLIPPGTHYEFTVIRDYGSADEIRQRVSYLNNPQMDILTKIRSAQALIADAIGKPIVFETEESYTNVASDYEHYTLYNVIAGQYTVLSTIVGDSPVGYFSKQFPDDRHLKFNFNIDDDSMYCVFSALFKQEEKLFEACNLVKPHAKDEHRFYLDIVSRCNLSVDNAFSIKTIDVANVYRLFGETFKVNFNLTYYYIAIGYQPPSIPRTTIKVVGDPNNSQVFKLAVAKLGEHIFNINKGTSKRKEAVEYLSEIAEMYDELKDRKTNRLKEITKISRATAIDFRQLQREELVNPETLLRGDPESMFEKEDEPDELGTNAKVITWVPFVFDFETVLNDKNEHCVYSYVIKKISTDGKHTPTESYFDRVPLHEKSVKARNNNFLVKLFQFVIKNTKKEERAILFAHNGAKFDNLICLKTACETYGMDRFREVNAGPNNDIMLSLDITYSYGASRGKVALDPKVISFRDSYKLLDCAASRIPSNYGTRSFKLPYCYQLYNNLFHDSLEKDNIKASQSVKSYFKKKQDNKFVNKDGSDNEKVMKEYEAIYDGSILNKPLSDDLRQDIIKYREQLTKTKSYYLPEEYCILYNKYDVIVVEEGLLKMQEYLRSLGSVESILNLIDNSDFVKNIQKQEDKDKIQKLREKVIEQNMCIPATIDLDLFKYRSLASMVFDIAKKNKVFENIYQLTGGLKKFVQLSVVGGRVMKNPNEEHSNYRSEYYDYFMKLVGQDRNDETDKEILRKAMLDSIIDNDAVSLYPSAISLCKMPAGKPEVHVFDEKKSRLVPKCMDKFLGMCDNDKERHFYCLDITTRKDIEFPILSEKDEGGIRRFRNGSFKKIVIGDIALRDAIKYQDAVITRVYAMVRFTSVCDRFANFIKTLFTLRLIFKAIKLPCQNAIKLVMNSSYGRTILKQSYYKKRYFRVVNEEDAVKFKTFLTKNYFCMKPEINRLGNFRKVSVRKLNDTPKGYPHVGSHILEMSKMLMNQMFNKIYEEGFMVYYTDTDSIHVKAGSLTKLGDMLGEEMTQFHSDFGEDGYRGVYCKDLGNNNPGIFAIRSIFVMKKCYFDKLFCINNATNKYDIIEHKRVKGITSGFMNEDRYQRLLAGDELECDLCEYRDMVLRKTKAGMLVSLDNFKRVIRKTN